MLPKRFQHRRSRDRELILIESPTDNPAIDAWQPNCNMEKRGRAFDALKRQKWSTPGGLVMPRNAAAPSNETTWRTLLGSCDDWPIPTAGPRISQQQTDRCELCREPIGGDRPFVTNSAGERATHIACLEDPTFSIVERRPTGGIWQRLLRRFIRRQIGSRTAIARLSEKIVRIR